MRKVAIVIPAYNEGNTLEANVLALYSFLEINAMQYCDIIIADNNSMDDTKDIGHRLVRELGYSVKYHFVAKPGKGSAIKNTWLSSEFGGYGIYSFMDADLSTEISALPRLIEEVEMGHGLVIGSRYMDGSPPRRSLKRMIASKGYRMMFNCLFDYSIYDPQCGFKAVSADVRNNVVPYIQNEKFFFDTELIVRTKNSCYSVKEIPVEWHEAESSTVKLKRDIPEFLYNLVKLKYDDICGRL